MAALGPLLVVGCGDDAVRPRGDAGVADAAVDGARSDGGRVPDAALPDAALVDAGLADGAGPDGDAADASADAGVVLVGARVRVVASNLTTGNFQAYELPGIRILDGLDPDVALMQEMNYGSSSASELRNFVDLAFGPTFSYYREPGVQIPNGVVSRFPILASGSWTDPQTSNRGFAWARIDVPGPKDLWAVSVHLLTSSEANRNLEATALVALVQAMVPAADFLVIGGDFNTDVRDEPCITTLGAVVSVAGPDPVDMAGNPNSNAGRSKPYDRVLADGDLVPFQAPVVLGGSSHASGLVLDTRVYTPLSDVAPALASDSAAPSMQHMAVVKDFIVPE
ncbi:MAG: endonuclease/exonuclease/phosphatase family protein [Deltaproteobacteria bacterium]|nr:endonuclease/exonuclease/phosphatase family protein [Deltaproteobacteria bacterium]